MKNRALIGLSAACMSALVATAVGCGEPAVDPYTPPATDEAAVEKTATPAADEAATTDEKAAATDDKAATTDDKAATTDAAADDKAAATDDKAAITDAAATDDKAATTDAAADDKAAATDTADAADKAATDDKAAATDGAALTDGEYTASAKGIGGDVPVTVTIKDGKISAVEVGENSETAGIGSKAIEQLPELIVAANGTEGVDAVSGASVTSKAIFTAVDDCLAQAASGDAAAATDDKAADAKAATTDDKAATTDAAATDEKAAATDDKAAATDAALADGEYTAEGKGIGGKVPVTVTVKDGKISAVTVGDNSETQGIGSKAIEQLPALIVEANGTEGVDAISGASVTSKAIFTAVDDALAQAASGDAAATDTAAADDKAAATTDDKAAATDAKSDDKAATTDTAAADDKAASSDEAAATFTDGTYTASAKGIGGDVPITLTIKDGKVASVEVGENSETQGIGSKAIEQLPELIVAANGTEGVDAVSGASVTSKAIFTATEDALAQASAGDAAATDDTAAADDKAATTDEKATEAKADDKAAATDDKAAATDTAATDDKAAADDKAATTDAAATDGALADGEYTAEGKGIGGKVPVTVTVKDGKISAVEVGENSETAGIGSKAIDQLPELIVAANGTDGVDAVSGASVTSKAIFTAVDDALAQAASGDAAATDDKAAATDAKADDKAAATTDDKAAATDTDAADAKATTTDAADKAATTDAKADDKAAATDEAALADGEYTAEGKGIGGKVPVTVTIKDGKIASVEVGDNSETAGIGSKAIEQLPELIVKANGTEGVDAISGASVTSKAIFTAVEDALAQAGAGDAAATDSKAATTDKAAAASLKDGEYTAEGKGIGGKVPVTVTVKDGKIASVEVGDNSETAGIGSKAIEQLPELIVKANGTDGVDAISGASVTSKAIFTAVEDALAQAQA